MANVTGIIISYMYNAPRFDVWPLLSPKSGGFLRTKALPGIQWHHIFGGGPFGL